MFKDEKKILFIIRYIPILITIILSLLTIYYLINQKNQIFNNEKEKIQNDFKKENKELVKIEVDNVLTYIKNQKNQSETKLKNRLKEAVNNAYAISLSIYKNNKDKPKAEIKRLIKESLADIRFGSNSKGYFFIYESTGKNILHLNKDLENKNFWNYQDVKGTYLLKEMYKILEEKNETFYEWYWPRKKEKESKKIGYFKLIKELGIFIGSGEFVKDFEEIIKKEILSFIQSIRFKKNGYIFILDEDGNYISFYDKKFIGKNIFNNNYVKNLNNIFSTMKKIAKVESGGYISYYHRIKPNFEKKKEKYSIFTKKTSYINGFSSWKWIIGSGFYLDDYNSELAKRKQRVDSLYKEQIESLVFVAFVVFMIFVIFAFYISSFIEKKFFSYKLKLEEKIKENLKKDELIHYQSKMASMGEMIGNIAHQWKQPLSTISTISSGIKVQKELGILSDDFEIKGLDSISDNVKYLSQTIDDFRNFLIPNKNIKEFDIKNCIEKSLKLVSAQYKSKDIVLIKEIKSIKLNGVENELVQVIINILNNARDELLKVNNDKRVILISTFIKNENLIISIQDSAKGIKNNNFEKIFKAYFSTKNSSNGTGIGLFMSKNIIEKQFLGKIEVSNEDFIKNDIKYHGANFRIIIPLNIKKALN